jgi:hypothetical protein
MSLRTLHDRARRLGLGAMFERHWAHEDFRDLFDHGSAAWRTSSIVEKANDLRALAAAGIGVDELIALYRETLAAAGDPTGSLARLPDTLEAYAEMGYSVAPPMPVPADAEPARVSGVVHGGAFKP